MGFWNNKPERDKKAKKREQKMTKQVTPVQVPSVPGVVTKAATPVTQYKQHYYGGGGTYAGGAYGSTYQYQRVVVPTPTDTKDTTKLSIVLMRQSVLNAISAICQPVAGSSEFQVHYRALVVRIQSETNELIISIPTTYYNFKQKVAHASVDYHLDDIDNAAAAVKPISDAVVKEIFKDMPLLGLLPELFSGTAVVTFSEVNSGSIHRHPGRFGFSGTDYTKTPSNPGVIYREAEATDKVHTDSVIYLGTRTEIYTTETRILNIAPKDNGVEGTYCQLPTTTFLLNDIAAPEAATDSMVEFLGGLEDTLKDTSGDYYITNAMGAINGYALVNEIISAFKEASFEQDISTVLASNITSNSFYQGVAYYGGHYGTAKHVSATGKKQETPSYKDLLDYDWGDDDYDLGEYSRASWGGSWRNGEHTPHTAKQQTPEVKKALPAPDKVNPYKVGSADWAEFNLRYGLGFKR